MTPAQILLCAVLPLSAAAASIDVRSGHIPNRLVLWGCVGGALLHIGISVALPASAALSVGGRFLAGLGGALAGVAAAAAVPYLLFRLGAMGGGDVKLLGALGAALGPSLGLQVQLLAFVLAALYAPAVLVFRGELWRRVKGAAVRAWRCFRPGAGQGASEAPESFALAFAPAVFAASVLLFCAHAWRG